MDDERKQLTCEGCNGQGVVEGWGSRGERDWFRCDRCNGTKTRPESDKERLTRERDSLAAACEELAAALTDIGACHEGDAGFTCANIARDALSRYRKVKHG